MKTINTTLLLVLLALQSVVWKLPDECWTRKNYSSIYRI